MRHHGFVILALVFLIACGSLAQRRQGRGVEEYNIPVEASKAPVLSEGEVQVLVVQLLEHLDRTQGAAGSGSIYAQRLSRLISGHRVVDGLSLDYRAYVTPQVNMLSFPGGSIRVFGGLMELMDDKELLFLLGNHIAHIRLGHAKRRLEVAVAGIPGKVESGRALTPPQWLAFEAGFHAAQYSLAQQQAADLYAVEFLGKNGYDTEAAVSALNKIGELPPRQAMFLEPDVIQARIQGVAGKKIGAVLPRTKKGSPLGHDVSSVGDGGMADAGEDSIEHVGAEAEVESGSLPSPSQAEFSGQVEMKRDAVATGEGEIKTATLRRQSSAKPAAKTVPSAEPPSVSGSLRPGWYLQIAADRNEIDALSRVNSLSAFGIEGHIEQAMVNNIWYYRVLIGPFATRLAAEQQKPRMSELNVVAGKPFPRKFD